MTPAFTLREWEKLPYGTGQGAIPELLAARLASAARAAPLAGTSGQGILEEHRTHLKARGVVGVIATENGSLEILPKIDVKESDPAAQNAAIRKQLVHMLAVARDMQIDTGRIAELDWQKETLLELLIRVFADKLIAITRKGMPRSYVQREEDLSALRGRLDAARQFTKHAVNPSRLACRFDELSDDIALNRILKAAVTQLSRVSRSFANQQKLRELAIVYADIADVPVPALPWGAVTIDRTNRAWSELFGMASMFLRKRYQTSSGGAQHGTALMFEMNALFEEYVGRLISRVLRGSAFTVQLQGGRLFCLNSLEDGRDLFQTRPDILIRHRGEVVHVIDTKWKRISARLDDPKQGVSQSDVYQMMAYCQLYAAPRLTLLYPRHDAIADLDVLLSSNLIGGRVGGGESAILETACVGIGWMEQTLKDLNELLLHR